MRACLRGIIWRGSYQIHLCHCSSQHAPRHKVLFRQHVHPKTLTTFLHFRVCFSWEYSTTGHGRCFYLCGFVVSYDKHFSPPKCPVFPRCLLQDIAGKTLLLIIYCHRKQHFNYVRATCFLFFPSLTSRATQTILSTSSTRSNILSRSTYSCLT